MHIIIKQKDTYRIFLGLVTFCVISGGLNAQVISAEQNYAASSPAVVMVQTAFSATVSVNQVEMNTKKFRQLVDSVKRLDTSGTMISAEEKLDMVVQALYDNPFRYFSGTNQYFRQRHRIISSGTGFFVTGDGYIVTNCHVIDRDSAFIRRKFILSTFQEVTEANIRSLQSSWAMTLTDEQRNLLYNSYSFIYSQVSSMILFDLKKEIFVLYRADSEGSQSLKMRKPARVILKGQAMPGKDVAILKIDSVRELPVLPVSAEPIARIGESVLVYGYPEPVTSNTYLAKETSIEPTLTSGIVSAVKKSIGGWPVFQMDAVITHGSSGSPVCSNEGKVIGLATFGSLEQNTGGLATGFNFAIPVSIVKEFLDSVKVYAHISRASETYNQGLDYFYKGYYRKARGKFEEVRKLNKLYPQLTNYIKQSNNYLAAGQDKEGFLQTYTFRIIALLLVIGGCMLIAYRAWKKKRLMA
jgi:S1-C subfamily serine protease